MHNPPVMTPRTGRPIKGERPIRALSRFLARLRPETHARLLAAAAVLGRPAYQVVEEAIAAHLGTLPDAVRDEIERRVRHPADP